MEQWKMCWNGHPEKVQQSVFKPKQKSTPMSQVQENRNVLEYWSIYLPEDRMPFIRRSLEPVSLSF